jgi:carbon starvation protein
VLLFKMKRERYAWVTLLPTAWLVLCTVTAGLQKLFHPDPGIGFLAHAAKFGAALDQGKVLAPAKTLEEMHRVVVNDRVDAALCALFIAVVLAMLVYGIDRARRALASPGATVLEEAPLAAEARHVA